MKTKFQATYSLDKETQEKLDKLAKERRTSKSQIITQLIWSAERSGKEKKDD